MLPTQKINQIAQDVQKAREDSLALWRDATMETKIRRDDEFVARTSDIPENRLLNLAGRYQVGDGNEFACEIRELCPEGLHVRGPKEARFGDWCTLSIASVGIVEGIVLQPGTESFKVGVIALPRRIQRLARRLRWELRRSAEGLPDRRSSERVEMKQATARLETSEGREFQCDIFDISDGGAALYLGASALYFWVDQPIKLNDRQGHVLRYFPGGLVVKFD